MKRDPEQAARLIAAAPKMLVALVDAESKLSAAATLLEAHADMTMRQVMRRGLANVPTVNYDCSGETDASGLATDCENAADRCRSAIAEVEGIEWLNRLDGKESMSVSVWLGLKTCGCPVAVCVDRHEAQFAEDVERTKREFLNQGLSVLHATWDDWMTKYHPAFMLPCYHEREAVK